MVEQEIWGLISVYIKNLLVSWCDDKKCNHQKQMLYVKLYLKKKKKNYNMISKIYLNPPKLLKYTWNFYMDQNTL